MAENGLLHHHVQLFRRIARIDNHRSTAIALEVHIHTSSANQQPRNVQFYRTAGALVRRSTAVGQRLRAQDAGHVQADWADYSLPTPRMARNWVLEELDFHIIESIRCDHLFDHLIDLIPKDGARSERMSLIGSFAGASRAV